MESATPAPTSPAVERYLEPDFATRRIVNPIMKALVGLGAGVRGGRLLHVRGRVSGDWQTVPVNPLTIDGTTYLVAPRGNTQWVRNLRVARTGRLQKGRRYTDFSAVEVTDADKAPIIRAYLKAWAMEVGKFFEGIDATSSDAELLEAAPGFPVFAIDMSAS
jgi:hypothetical protein